MFWVRLREARGRARESFTIAVIPQGSTHEFWKSIHAGAIKASRDLAAEGTFVNVIWKAVLGGRA